MTRVLLYSGGMDSYAAARVWQPDVLLYVALGHRYEAEELRVIDRSGAQVTVDRRLYLGDLERPDAIIPLRNLYLLMVATHYGGTLGLGALQGEVNGDKSEAFRQQAQQVLRTCYAPSYWSAGVDITVEYPVVQHTKVTLLAAYLEAGGDGERIVRDTRSCYAPGPLPCGWCSACVKRHVALRLNGLQEATANPVDSAPALRGLQDRWGTFDHTRRCELARAYPHAFPPPGQEQP